MSYTLTRVAYLTYPAVNLTFDVSNHGLLINESWAKEGNLTPITLWGQDSNKTIVFDFGGVSMTVNVTVVKTGDVSDLKTLVTSIKALANGEQSKTCTFVSDILDTMNVKIMGINGERLGKRRISYTVRMVEADSTL